jgi:hypothetical protein
MKIETKTQIMAPDERQETAPGSTQPAWQRRGIHEQQVFTNTPDS